ncbi:MAG: SH3 domain-containing protein [Chloroflexi bacterium]|nr:SH3 domain-containing protein [Chloroflexota bacterium]
MKVKLFLILILITLFLFGSLARAQGYAIRTEVNANLRSGPGLDYRWVETAPTSAVLQVIGESGSWLQIDRNGRELWMANWLGHSHVNDGAQPSAPASAEIDNCCFVDRQCASQQEWENGYWAFQNHQCPAPAQPLAVNARTPASQIAAGVDNCCFLGMHCASENDWLRGYAAFQRNQCKHPEVRIDGGPRFVAQVEAALDLLKSGAPYWYAYTVNELKEIAEVGEGILGIDTSARIFYLPPSHAYLYNNRNLENALVWLAGVLVHEACHIYRHKEGWRYGTEFERFREEAFCQSVQIKALDVFDPKKRFHSYLQGLVNEYFGRGYKF